MKRPRNRWKPAVGQYARYIGRSSRLLRGGRTVEIIAEASKNRTVVKAIGHAGSPVCFTVATRNLGRPQPDLFD